ncbi:DUF397 domain-containing protein [Streptomyces marincola]|uniref:DUF397 domain-containing protein n=1 Tax=Streptomyces marincola TaxID=2878388 RepID=A0A1W7CUU6_9ACTN|nr:DUF397 domain-containing protein [Streptomyces marincola]ARQ68512.1 hypothetical protein CAG99_06270 [Streptomyces marincola]
MSHAEWVTSSYSNDYSDACVAWAPGIAAATGVVPVRDSKVPDGPVLSVPSGSWDAFLRDLTRRTA